MTLLFLGSGAVVARPATLDDTLALIRDHKLSEAVEQLKILCPVPRGKLSKAVKKGNETCQILVFAIAEQDKIRRPTELSNMYWVQGETAVEAGNLNRAELLYQIAIDKDPNNQSNWHSFGILHHKQERYADALKDFERACSLNDNDPLTVYWVARTRMDLNDLEVASDLVDLLLLKDPAHARAYWLRGEIFMRQQNWSAALAAFQLAEDKGVPKSYVRPRIEECKSKLGEQ
jgi:tetratricopeptide (TPR) repeat protein